jgi:hypothetical protein
VAIKHTLKYGTCADRYRVVKEIENVTETFYASQKDGKMAKIESSSGAQFPLITLSV